MIETKQIKRQYIIKSKELNKKLNLKGQIIAINLWSGKKEKDDEWEFETIVTNSSDEQKDKD